MKSVLLPRCQCCGEVPAQGLYDGIRIRGVMFCRECTRKVTEGECGGRVYERFLAGVRKALFSKKRHSILRNQVWAKGELRDPLA